MSVRDWIEEYYPEYYGWFEYPSDATVAFCGTREEWGILGNFGRTPLVVDGVEFNCAEALFQVMKFTDPAARRDIHSRAGQRIKMQARHWTKEVGVRPGWGRMVVDVLKFCLMTKYAQSEAFRDELARTGDRFIVEMQSNTLRPANTYNAKRSDDGQTWSGPNLMGRLLMELRDKGRLEYSLPDNVMRFPDLR